jgi:hypothetical protein
MAALAFALDCALFVLVQLLPIATRKQPPHNAQELNAALVAFLLLARISARVAVHVTTSSK